MIRIRWNDELDTGNLRTSSPNFQALVLGFDIRSQVYDRLIDAAACTGVDECYSTTGK